jgi:hypothetical protein
MDRASDSGDLSLEPSPEAAVIKMPPAPGGGMIIDRGPAAAFGATEEGVGSMDEPDVNTMVRRIENDAVDPPGVWQGQES